MPSAHFGKIATSAGRVRWLGLVSLLLAVWLSWQPPAKKECPLLYGCRVCHVSAPITIATTFLRRGTPSRGPRCSSRSPPTSSSASPRLWPCGAAHNRPRQPRLPQRLIYKRWIATYSLYQIIIGLFELSLFSYESLLASELRRWEKQLVNAESPEAAKRMLDEAESTKARRVAGVERRLSIFALPAGVAFWVFASPASAGFLVLLAATRPLRDATGIWMSYRTPSGTKTQREFYDTVTTVLSGLYLAVSLGAWMWAGTRFTAPGFFPVGSAGRGQKCLRRPFQLHGSGHRNASRALSAHVRFPRGTRAVQQKHASSLSLSFFLSIYSLLEPTPGATH